MRRRLFLQYAFGLCAVCFSAGCVENPQKVEDHPKTFQFTERDFELRVTVLVTEFINRQCEGQVVLGEMKLETTNTSKEFVFVPAGQNAKRPVRIIIEVNKLDEATARLCADGVGKVLLYSLQCKENPTAPVGSLSA